MLEYSYVAAEGEGNKSADPVEKRVEIETLARLFLNDGIFLCYRDRRRQ